MVAEALNWSVLASLRYGWPLKWDKKLTLSEVLDRVLESDEEVDLSDITESEDEIRDYEDDDANHYLFNLMFRYFQILHTFLALFKGLQLLILTTKMKVIMMM